MAYEKCEIMKIMTVIDENDINDNEMIILIMKKY
jgi:hypothetical protein